MRVSTDKIAIMFNVGKLFFINENNNANLSKNQIDE